MNNSQDVAQQSLITASERLQAVIEYSQILDRYIFSRNRATQSMLPELSFAPDALTALGPKYPARNFSYLEELAIDTDESPTGNIDLLDEVARYFRGAIRPESRHSLFNMVPEPSVEATAAAWLATAYNTNSLMDVFGGEALLIEQQVARRIGRWAGWENAMGIR